MEKNKRIFKNQKAITLIALVITIIVLLILAGVSIATLTGDNGILSQAETAKADTQRASVIEQAKIDILAWQTEQMSNGQSAELTNSKVKEILTEKDYLKDGTLDDEGFKNKDGEIVFEYSELYKKTEGKGKTIAELYDGINNPEDENYNENAMHIGDWVNYTAGTWEETVKEPELGFEFGGYNNGQSRDENADGMAAGKREEAVYEGWRIWDISEDEKTMILISAGCPEEYYSPDGGENGYNKGYISEYILSGNVNANVDAIVLGLGTTYKTRDWSMYKNEKQYANSARALSKSDLDTWYGKYINSSITDSSNIEDFPENTENKLISIIENRCIYWFCSSWDNGGLWSFCTGAHNVAPFADAAMGIRVLVSLTPEVKFEEIPEQVTQDGFTYNKWIIESK